MLGEVGKEERRGGMKLGRSNCQQVYGGKSEANSISLR